MLFLSNSIDTVKLVLQQALKNVGFYDSYPTVSDREMGASIDDGFKVFVCLSLLQLVDETTRVWLLLYDMYLRKFVKREPETVPEKDELFREANLLGKHWRFMSSGSLFWRINNSGLAFCRNRTMSRTEQHKNCGRFDANTYSE